MARLLIEDAVIFLLAFHIVCSVIFASNMLYFDSYFPGQRFNVTTMSFETRPLASVGMPMQFGNMDSLNQSFNDFNASAADPNAMMNPIATVQLVASYISLVCTLLGYNYLYYVLILFIGPEWSFMFTIFLNILCFIVFIRVLSGRLRWD